jgi:anti-anti-sigma regulatory factor
MELSVHENQGVTVVIVSGEMDAGTAPSWERNWTIS